MSDDTLAEWVARVVAQAPPLTADQRTKLAELLRPAREQRAARNRQQAAESIAA